MWLSKLEEKGKMSKVAKTTGPFYCQSALKLCIQARQLCAGGECKKVSEICSFVSTLCPENQFETCVKESSICSEVARFCVEGQNSEGCTKARAICVEARKLCPQNNIVAGV